MSRLAATIEACLAIIAWSVVTLVSVSIIRYTPVETEQPGLLANGIAFVVVALAALTCTAYVRRVLRKIKSE